MCNMAATLSQPEVDSLAMIIVGECAFDFVNSSAIHNGETSKDFVQLVPTDGPMSAVGAKFGDGIRKVMGIWWGIISQLYEGVQNAPKQPNSHEESDEDKGEQ